MYDHHTKRIEAGSRVLDADDIFARAKKGKENGASGLDARKPAELKPRSAWVARLWGASQMAHGVLRCVDAIPEKMRPLGP